MAKVVKGHFREYKKILLGLVGNAPMYEDTIDTIGKSSFGERWAGVYSSDEAKKLLQMRDVFAIVNTATSRGRGSHWLGVYMTPKGAGYLYDSFGREASQVIWRLNRAALAENIALHNTDSIAEQRGTSAVCGQLCLSWLLTTRDLGIKRTAAAI